MVKKYDTLKAQNKITIEESALLEAEKKEKSRKKARLSEKVMEALKGGLGLQRQFHGWLGFRQDC